MTLVSPPNTCEPAFAWSPDSYTTLGGEVADLCDQIGFSPDVHQRAGLRMLFGARRDRTWTAFEACVIAPRQEIKTGLLKMAAIGDLALFDAPLHLWTAHRVDAATLAFRDIRALIDGSSMLSRRVKSITEGNGDEEIILQDVRAGTTSTIQFGFRSKGAGRSKSASTLTYDEALFLTPSQMGDSVPTLATVARAQVRYGSSAGMGNSDVLRALRDRGRASGDPGLMYLEYADLEPPACELGRDCDHKIGTDGCSLDDETRWERASPALGVRITRERLASFRRMLPAAEFAREILGWWDDSGMDSAMSAVEWQRCRDPESGLESAPLFAVDVSPAGDWATITAAGMRSDGLPHVEVTSSTDDAGRQTMDDRPGTDWVVPRFVDLASRWSDVTVRMIAGGQAEALKPDLEAAGIRYEVVPANQIGAMCGYWLNKVRGAGLRHLGQASLTAATLGAVKRDIGDNTFAWGRRKGANITALYSANVAVWALTSGASSSDVSFFNFGELDMCDACGRRPHNDPDGGHDYLCEECRKAAK